MDTEGCVFSIQKFSIHDGPGIRTTVFLKGCPLNCTWCHNPESKSTKVQLSYKEKMCTNCMACAGLCSVGAHSFDNGVHTIDFNKCNGCMKCVSVCNYGALEKIGFNTTATKLINSVIKDIDYYNKSGGGITISGGDPLFQHKFTKEILELAKKNNIHTCVETSGYCSKDALDNIIKYTDLFLYDYKISDSDDFKKYVGGKIEVALDNLKYLVDKGCNIILRCPIIPGINDIDKHFKAISSLSLKYRLPVELMPYHSLGKSKARQIGVPYEIKVESVEENMLTGWVNIMKKLGVAEILN